MTVKTAAEIRRDLSAGAKTAQGSAILATLAAARS